MRNIFKIPVIKLVSIYKTEKRNIRLIFRNHWTLNFNDSFIFVLDKKLQGFDCKTYRLGFFNFCFVIIDSKDR